MIEEEEWGVSAWGAKKSVRLRPGHVPSQITAVTLVFRKKQSKQLLLVSAYVLLAGFMAQCLT